MRSFYLIILPFIFPLTANAQDLDVSITHLSGGCAGPDSLVAQVISSSLGIQGIYNYKSFDYECAPPDTLTGQVAIEETLGGDTYRFTDFSFGTWEQCLGISGPTGSLNFSYDNNNIGELNGTDNYGDGWQFDSFIRVNNTYVVEWSNDYGDFGTVILTPDDGRVLPPVEGEAQNLVFLWSTGETTDRIEITEEGLYTLIVSDSDGNNGSGSINVMFADAFPDAAPLLALYNSLEGAQWRENNGWKEAAAGEVCDPCDWFGVRCFGGSRVNSIDLNENNLSGTLPMELGGLSELRFLDLSNNNISGTIPAGIVNMVRLSGLTLDRNSLEGELPSFLGELNSLRTLSIAENKLTGQIPASLSNLMLFNLDLNSNKLSGEIPQELTGISSLGTLVLFNNELSGSIPEGFGKLENLTGLYLSYNNLTGSIPDSLGSGPRMTELYLDHNNISGTIPDNLFIAPALTKLYLHSNNLSGCFPEVKDSICLLPQATNELTVELNGEAISIFIEDGYNVKDNPLLPWQGELERHCLGEEQIGAACDDGISTPGDAVINADCECKEKGVGTYELEGVKIEIYPNPIIDELYVNVDSPSGVNATLFDAQGKKIMDIVVNKRNNLSGIASGIYVLKIKTSNLESLTERIIKI